MPFGNIGTSISSSGKLNYLTTGQLAKPKKAWKRYERDRSRCIADIVYGLKKLSTMHLNTFQIQDKENIITTTTSNTGESDEVLWIMILRRSLLIQLYLTLSNTRASMSSVVCHQPYVIKTNEREHQHQNYGCMISNTRQWLRCPKPASHQWIFSCCGGCYPHGSTSVFFKMIRHPLTSPFHTGVFFYMTYFLAQQYCTFDATYREHLASRQMQKTPEKSIIEYEVQSHFKAPDDSFCCHKQQSCSSWVFVRETDGESCDVKISFRGRLKWYAHIK